LKASRTIDSLYKCFQIFQGERGLSLVIAKGAPVTMTEEKQQKNTGLAMPGEQSGAILPIVAMVAGTLILFVGLAIDTSFISVSKSQQDAHAARSALAALHAWKTSSLATEVEKMNLAQDRVRDMLEKNYVMSESTQQSFNKTVGNTASDYASVRFGNWYFDDPGCGDPANSFDSTAECPCPGAIWKRPCFSETTPAEVSNMNAIINAYEVNLSTVQNNPIKNYFGRVAGQGDVYLHSSAVAATYGRNVVFLIDLSRSSFEESHFSQAKIQDTATGYPGLYLGNQIPGYNASEAANNPYFASDYNFRCNEATVSDCNEHLNDGTPVWNCDTPLDCTMSGGAGIANSIWNTLLATAPTAAPLGHGGLRDSAPLLLRENPLKHFKDDYAGLELANSNVYGFHYIDAHCQASDQSGVIEGYMNYCPAEYFGPEPISSILAGVNHALDLLMPVDGVGVIGFDSVASNYHRRFHGGVSLSANLNDALSLAHPFAPEPVTETSAIAPIMERLREVVDVEARDGGNFLKRVQNHHFLALDEDNLNIPLALNEAMIVLQNAPDFERSENMIVLISDGITNCSGNICGDDYSSYQTSMAEVESYIDTHMVSRGVEFHFINVGDQAGAHQLLRRGVAPMENGCMSPGAFSSGQSLVNNCASCVTPTDCAACADPAANWDAFRLGQEKFYGANSLYTKALETGGTYKAVLPPCDPALLGGGLSLAQCREGQFENSMDALCEAGGAPGDIVTEANLTDPAGRIVCEPGCRTKSEQIKQHMEKIFDSPGFIIVE